MLPHATKGFIREIELKFQHLIYLISSKCIFVITVQILLNSKQPILSLLWGVLFTETKCAFYWPSLFPVLFFNMSPLADTNILHFIEGKTELKRVRYTGQLSVLQEIKL